MQGLPRSAHRACSVEDHVSCASGSRCPRSSLGKLKEWCTLTSCDQNPLASVQYVWRCKRRPSLSVLKASGLVALACLLWGGSFLLHAPAPGEITWVVAEGKNKILEAHGIYAQKPYDFGWARVGISLHNYMLLHVVSMHFFKFRHRTGIQNWAQSAVAMLDPCIITSHKATVKRHRLHTILNFMQNFH